MFSLLTKPWIPVAGRDPVSLNELFENDEAYELCGPVADQLACFLFLRALTQRACEDALEYREDWQDLTSKVFRRKVLDYLHKHEALFDLEGEKPFLQYVALRSMKAEKSWSLSELRVGVSTGNTTILTERESSSPLTVSELVCSILRLVAFPWGGKYHDKSITLQQGLIKNKATGRALTIGMYGYLHNFAWADGLVETLRYNLLTKEDIDKVKYIKGMGVPAWERLPDDEGDFRFTLYEFLFPVSRFFLIQGDRVIVTDGVRPDLSPGMVPPSVSVREFMTSKKNNKSKIETLDAKCFSLPWRHIGEILPFYSKETKGWHCVQTEAVRDRKGRKGVWSLGIQVSYKSGDQYVTANDGFVSQVFKFPDEESSAEVAYARYHVEMKRLEKLVGLLSKATNSYWSDLRIGKNLPERIKQAEQNFWFECDKLKDELEILCDTGDVKAYRAKTRELVGKSFDRMCPKIPGIKRLEAWAKNRPFLKTKDAK